MTCLGLATCRMI